MSAERARGAPVLAVLTGARVRRVDVPAPDLVAITLALPTHETSTLVVSIAEAAPGLGLVDERPRGEPAASAAQLLRKHLNGAALETPEATGPSEMALSFQRDEGRAMLAVSLRRRAPGWALYVGGRALAGAPHGPGSVGATVGAPDASEWPRDLDELRIAGAALMARRRGEGERGAHAELRRALVKARARVARRAQAIAGDLAGAAASTALRRDGATVLAHLASIPAFASEVVLDDPETGEPRRIALDPARSATENAERWFVRARKLDRGATIATARLADAEREMQRFDAALEALARGETALGESLVASGKPGGGKPHGIQPGGKRTAASTTTRVPYRTFALEDGTTVLVGRGARDNDALTFRHAAPSDLFLHARGATGAHVILRRDPRDATQPVRETALAAAAALAAHFSASRGNLAVDVTYAPRSEVRRGRAPGQVVMRASQTYRVRMDEHTLEALLARELGTT